MQGNFNAYTRVELDERPNYDVGTILPLPLDYLDEPMALRVRSITQRDDGKWSIELEFDQYDAKEYHNKLSD